MIVATYIIFNDIETIRESIESIYDQVDRIICIDGKFKDFFDCQTEISTDGTIQYLLDKPKVEIYYAPNLTEPEKRSRYLDLCFDGDTVINLDADEILNGKLEPLDVDICGLRIYDHYDKNGRLRYCRHFKYRTGLHYHLKHYLIKDAEGNLFASLKRYGNYSNKISNTISIINFPKKRSIERQRAKLKYYRYLTNKESKISDYD